MKFYAEITANTKPKNKAEEASSQELKKLNNCLVLSEEKRDELIECIESRVLEINNEYSRCGDVLVRKYNFMTNEISIVIGDCTTLTFKPVKEEIK